LREELLPYSETGAGLALNGPPVQLTPKAALALSLAVHELSTNAAKFGALSKPGGRIAIDWRWDETGAVTLSWRESGGPLVTPPQRRGFGSSLIERALALETGGHATLNYLRRGVVCEVFLPATAIHAVDLQRSEAEAPEPMPQWPATADAADVALRVLVVEDSSMVLLGLEAVLDDLGWIMVGPATRLADALTIAASAAFDIALLDVNLDGEMSWDVAAVIRRRGIPFVFATGYNAKTILPDAFRDTPVLGKPFTQKDLEKTLRGTSPAPGSQPASDPP